MTTLPLKEYLNQISTLLEENQYDSVIGHCYHILKQYPRHVDTYRLLAKGLLGAGRTEEAAEIFQRILSTDPNDLIAHIALSDIAQTEGKTDVALYHLERAFELDPYNGAIQEELNRHYESPGDFSATRIQLNEGGLARLYVQGEMYDQAIRLLEESIANNISRVDLEELMAEALWREGNRVEAAEVSLKVLDNLPNSIVANAVLTDIWFGSGRISDAKKHAKNLQSMVLADKRTLDRESVVGIALTAEGAPELPELFEIETLEEMSAADVAVTMRDMDSVADGSPQQEIESDVGDMYDWLSGVVKPSAEHRMEEVLEPDSWPVGEETVAESDWFVDATDDESEQDSPTENELMLLEREDASDDDAADLLLADDDLADQFVLEFNEQAKSSADLPEWIAAEDEVLSIDELSAEQEDHDDTLPDWLSEAASEDFEPIRVDSVTASQWFQEDQNDDAAESDDWEALPEAVKDTQDWLADLTQELTEITNEEPAKWLSDEPVQERAGETDWFADFVTGDPLDETESAYDQSINSEDLLRDESLVDEVSLQSSEQGSESADIDSWLHEEQSMASPMNDKNQEPEKKKPSSKADNEQQSDIGDWLADLTSSDAEDDIDWFDDLEDASEQVANQDAEAYESQEFNDFWANLDDESDSVSKDDTLLAESTEDEDFEDIDQWLNDLSKSEEESGEDWISNLVDEEPPDNSGFTDWLNSQVVEDEDQLPSESVAEVDAKADNWASGDEEADDEEAEVYTGLTGLLDDTQSDSLPHAQEESSSLTDFMDEIEVEEAQSEDEWADLMDNTAVSESLTDLLADDEPEEAIGLTDLLEQAQEDALSESTDEHREDVSDIFDIPVSQDLTTDDDEGLEEEPFDALFVHSEDDDHEEIIEETDIFDLMGEKGLTDLLGEAGAEDASEAAMPSADEVEPLPEPASSEDDWAAWVDSVESETVSDETDDWLAMLDQQEEASEDLFDEAEDVETGLTDLLDDTAVDDSQEHLTHPASHVEHQSPDSMQQIEEDGSGIFDLPDFESLTDESEEESLTDLLEAIDGDLLVEEDDLDYLALANAEESSLTDLLTGEDSEAGVADDDFAFPDVDTLGDMAAEDESDDVLATIDTNLPDWLSESPDTETLDDDVPFDWLDDDDSADDEEEEAIPQTTGLLRKIDELPGIKAAIEESSQHVEEDEPDNIEEEEEEAFEPTMTDFLTSSEDSAWLDQLADQDERAPAELEWMNDEAPAPELDWLDTDVLAEENGELDETLMVDTPEAEEEIELDSTPSDLDDAMSWLDDMVVEEETPIESLPTVAEILDDEINAVSEEQDSGVEVSEATVSEQDWAGLSDSDIASDEVDQTDIPAEASASLAEDDDALTEALAEIDDAMAWLDELDEETQAVESTAFMQEEPPTDAVHDDLDLSDEEEMDDAMAWLEQLAANRGAPLDELPTVSEKTTVMTPPPDADDRPEVQEMDDAIDDELADALDWLETVALQEREGETSESQEISIPETTDEELADALDWLQKVALNGGGPGSPEIEDESIEAVEEAETAVDTPTADVTESAIDEEDLFAAVFDIPDDQDAAMAWLEEDEEDTAGPTVAEQGEPSQDSVEREEKLSEAAVSDSIDIESSKDEQPLDDSVESLMDGIFDIPDDPDAAMAWLEEAAEEVETPLGDEREGPVDDQPPAAEVAVVDDANDELDTDLFENVPEDPDAAMAWLERLAAKQGAPLAELPSVDEQVDDIETPEWIAAQMAQAAQTAADEKISQDDTFSIEDRPVLPGLEDEASDLDSPTSQQDIDTPIQTDELEASEEDDLPEGLPDWFSLDTASGLDDEIQSQTDWLDSIPELGGTAWLTSESEAASIHSESVDILPDTGPLMEAASFGTGPLPDLDPITVDKDEEEASPEDDLASIIEEPDSSVYRVDRERLNQAKTAVEQQDFSSAVNIFQSLISDGNGMMLLIGELEIISESHPNDPAFRRLLGDAYMRNGQLQKALVTYREALDQL